MPTSILLEFIGKHTTSFDSNGLEHEWEARLGAVITGEEAKGGAETAPYRCRYGVLEYPGTLEAAL